MTTVPLTFTDAFVIAALRALEYFMVLAFVYLVQTDGGRRRRIHVFDGLQRIIEAPQHFVERVLTHWRESPAPAWLSWSVLGSTALLLHSILTSFLR